MNNLVALCQDERCARDTLFLEECDDFDILLLNIAAHVTDSPKNEFGATFPSNHPLSSYFEVCDAISKEIIQAPLDGARWDNRRQAKQRPKIKEHPSVRPEGSTERERLNTTIQSQFDNILKSSKSQPQLHQGKNNQHRPSLDETEESWEVLQNMCDMKYGKLGLPNEIAQEVMLRVVGGHRYL